MKIISLEKTSIPGIIVITPEVYDDERGYFFESFNKETFKSHGLPYQFVQDNQSLSKKGTLRGFHYQLKHQQGKLVRAIKGKVFDVAVDIRIGSPTFGKSVSLELSDRNNKIMYIPEGCAHAYLVLSDSALFQYKCTEVYHPEDEYGIAWNDPEIKINWPIRNPILSVKDSQLPSLNILKNKKLPLYK
jgi:dTDP-4-dehydrorhamnose 3,5-epimerase